MGLGVDDIGRRLLSDQHISRYLFQQFSLPIENLLLLIEIVQELLTRVFQGPQENRHRDLPASVDTNIEKIFLIEFEIDPGSPIRNNAGVVEELPPGMRFDLVLIKKDPGGAMELADDHPFRPIDNECPILRHQGNFTEIDLLLLHRLDALGFRLLIHVPNDQADGHLDWSSVGHSPEETLLHVILGLGQPVADKFERSRLIKIFDRENSLKDSLKSDRFPFLRIRIGLQKFFVGSLLNLDQVGDIKHLFDL